MAPELLAGQPATIASEVYAIGVLLFNLLTAQYPVEGADLEKLRAAHASGARRTVLDVRPDLPRSAGPRRRDGDQHDTAEALRQHGADDCRAVRGDRHGSPGTAVAAAAREAARLSRLDAGAGRRRARPCSWPSLGCGRCSRHGVSAQRRWPARRRTTGGPTICWRTTIGHRRSRRRFHCSRRPSSQDPRFAPAFADLGRANLLQFTQQRDTKYIEPARESSLRALALAPDLASAHVTLGVLVRVHGAERPREPRAGGGAAARQVQRGGVRRAGGTVQASRSHRTGGAHAQESHQPRT